MSKTVAKIKRVWLQFRILTIRDGWKKANYLKKKGIFHHIGNNCYYAPIYLPAEPELISLHDNVVVSAGVRLITHSVAHVVYNHEEGVNNYLCRFGKIEIGSNVYIGADAKIQFDVNIGDNCIIAAGSIVTKDVMTDSVVAGIPAIEIGKYSCSKQKALEYSKSFGNDYNGDTWVSELLNEKPIVFND